MGFMSSCDLTICSVDDTTKLKREKLEQYAFQSIDNAPGEESAQGWANIDNFFDCEWRESPPEKGEWLTFAWRRDKRSVQAAVLRKRVEEQLASYEAKGLKVKKKEVKEQVKSTLLAKADPVPSAVDCAVSMKSGLLLIASTSKGNLEAIEGLLGSSFGVEVHQKTTEADVAGMFVQIFQEGVQTEYEGASYTLSYADQMTLVGDSSDDKAAITIKNDRETVGHALDNEFTIQKIRVNLSKNDEEAFTWNFFLKYDQGQLSIHSVRLPAPEGNDDYKDDQDAMFVFRMDLFETLVNILCQIFEMKE